MEEAKRRKEDEKRMKIEAKVKAETNKSKVTWFLAILVIIVMAGMYLAFVNAIEKKKPVTL